MKLFSSDQINRRIVSKESRILSSKISTQLQTFKVLNINKYETEDCLMTLFSSDQINKGIKCQTNLVSYRLSNIF